jgi:type II secretory pathway pseudopilin PulG
VTLIELMAVIVIIGLFVALGFPAMGGVLEDRHAARAAEDIANIFRIARSRAAATGAAHRVSVNAASATAGTLTLRTALTNVGGPTSSCVTPFWTDADSRLLQTIDLSATGSGSLAGRGIQITPLAGVSATVDYCFSPGGTSWFRTGGGLWARPTGGQIAGWIISRKDDSGTTTLGLQRRIRVLPSGIPSIEAF